MKAPEKIHIQPNAHDGWFEGKTPNGLPNGLFVEYIRTDAFIEKTCKWLKDRIEHDSIDYPMATFELLNDFKKAMGE